MSCGVGHRRGSDPMLLWLWCRPAATAPIGPLAWEPPYAEGAAQEIAKRPKKKKKIYQVFGISLFSSRLCMSRKNLPFFASLALFFLCPVTITLLFFNKIKSFSLRWNLLISFFHSMNVITFIVVQQSSQPQFYSMSLPNPQLLPSPPTCLLWKP